LAAEAPGDLAGPLRQYHGLRRAVNQAGGNGNNKFLWKDGALKTLKGALKGKTTIAEARPVGKSTV